MHDLRRNVEPGQLAFEAVVNEAHGFTRRMLEEKVFSKQGLEIVSPPNECGVYPYTPRNGIAKYKIDHSGFTDLTVFTKDQQPPSSMHLNKNARRCLNCLSGERGNNKKIVRMMVVPTEYVSTLTFIGWVTYLEMTGCGPVDLPSYMLPKTVSSSVEAGVHRAISNAFGAPL